MNESVGFVDKLRQLLSSWGLYDESSTNPFAIWKFLDALDNGDAFISGFIYTLEVSILALLIAIVFGTIGGVMATSKIKILRAYTRVYVELFQNIPLVIQIFFLYFALPGLGIHLDIFTIGVLGIGAYHGAYVSEVVRSGILSVPRGQFEASSSQGFTYVQQMRYIIVPQTIKIILPPMTNQMVNLIKNTSVLLIIGGAELMHSADSYAADYGNYAPAYIFAAILYFIICYPLAYFAKVYEDKLKKAHLTR
ncbi:amino acid ABC transporter permease [Campylobacter coli]|uniref:Putative glutamine transport system permease protein GlnP n=3 Tax=Campylobacter TaxID=194 RepID=A0A5Z1RTP7_CAMCO|nr:amino acid ABC transporter permease [Campylobacter coli]EIA88415.1 amino acid ABC transporter, permease protein PEB1 [Campylobacter coli 67-8]APA59683.1 amino acid ABC transporter permease [Campylobacter coli]EAH7887790.1 amino acid ABC transporter permease [Campylobacter coli]EAH7891298.1 amino acid ABC transporter permease [Campylobacter coli]EAH7894936.1 amino acid ABC transporter permease [Campylobacter coli]